jgi:hypothetical protein
MAEAQPSEVAAHSGLATSLPRSPCRGRAGTAGCEDRAGIRPVQRIVAQIRGSAQQADV